MLIAPAVDITEVWWARTNVEGRQKAVETKSFPLPGECLEARLHPFHESHIKALPVSGQFQPDSVET